jgi:hypothetical protein
MEARNFPSVADIGALIAALACGLGTGAAGGEEEKYKEWNCHKLHIILAAPKGR